MSFIRSFDNVQREKMMHGVGAELFLKLKADVMNGTVFPAVRKNELHFYYKGGCLYKFSAGAFRRNEAYEKYNDSTEGLADYEKAKKQNENKFTSVKGFSTERQFLDKLNGNTFCGSKKEVVVLDTEVNLNGNIGGGKKCDTVLFNSRTGEIMFVEGKIFSDGRVNVSPPHIPEVIEQVNTYTEAIKEQRENIIKQYSKHIEIINGLFGTDYPPCTELVEPAKLLVYKTPEILGVANSYSKAEINKALGEHNVLWVQSGDNPELNYIWEYFCGREI